LGTLPARGAARQGEPTPQGFPLVLPVGPLLWEVPAAHLCKYQVPPAEVGIKVRTFEYAELGG